jgi:hypothetical protein
LLNRNIHARLAKNLGDACVWQTCKITERGWGRVA